MPKLPIDEYTMGGLIRDAGLTVESFRKLLWPSLAWGGNRVGFLLVQQTP